MLRLNDSYVFYDSTTGVPYVALGTLKGSRIIKIRPAVKANLMGSKGSVGFAPNSEAASSLLGATFKVRVTAMQGGVTTAGSMTVNTSDTLSSNSLADPKTVDTIPIPTGGAGQVLVDTIIPHVVGNYVQFTIAASGVGNVLVEVFPIER